MTLLARLTFALCASACLARACSCSPTTVDEAKKNADIVFRATITALRDASNGERVAVFHVARVWKGAVSETFEMPAITENSTCVGFWPKHLVVGADLLVYAFKRGSPPAYFTSICTRTGPAKDSKDFERLGSGKAPKTK